MFPAGRPVPGPAHHLAGLGEGLRLGGRPHRRRVLHLAAPVGGGTAGGGADRAVFPGGGGGDPPHGALRGGKPPERSPQR
ncbi:hypothetical protein B5G43_06835 [Flavonifractor sp. An92]|nr:hypothetical protein B5G43_06835 [Flavonifractor sp. An92]OUQ24496.1 hypothetical protein B5E80_06735 [Flavonifractor sp. An135]